jgi:hypothetical protein
MLRVYCSILLIFLIQSTELQADNGSHQPYSPEEWPVTLNLRQLNPSKDLIHRAYVKCLERVKTSEDNPGSKLEEFRKWLFPIQNKQYEQIALRSMLEGTSTSVCLSFIAKESGDKNFSKCHYFSSYSHIGELEAYEGDLNGDTFKDYVFIKYCGGNGIAWGHADVALVMSEGENNFSIQVLETYLPEPKDFISINGQTVFIHASFQRGGICTDGENHNFWIYRLYALKGNQLVAADHLSPDFPKIIWYSFKPNYQETSLLTQKRKDELIAKSAMVFKEKESEMAFE